MTIKDDIETILNLPALEVANSSITTANNITAITPLIDDEAVPPTDFEVDFETARANIQNLLNQGHSLFDLAKEYAEDSESARSFEVATGLLKALTGANIDLLEIHEKRRKIAGEVEESQQIHVDKAVFVGTTADLQKQIKGD